MFIPDRKVGPNLEKLVSRTDESALTMRTAVDSGDGNITYVGEATPGTATSEAKWRIMKVDKTTGTAITWADGDGEFDNEWDEREALSYE